MDLNCDYCYGESSVDNFYLIDYFCRTVDWKDSYRCFDILGLKSVTVDSFDGSLEIGIIQGDI